MIAYIKMIWKSFHKRQFLKTIAFEKKFINNYVNNR